MASLYTGKVKSHAQWIEYFDGMSMWFNHRLTEHHETEEALLRVVDQIIDKEKDVGITIEDFKITSK